MKRILATTAIVALSAMPVLAQSDTTDQTAPSATESSDMTTGQSGTKANPEANAGSAADTTTTADTATMPELSGDERAALTAEDLQGVALYDSADEHVGEISDIVVTDDGQVEHVIVDVGGFLGLGEKPVAVDFDDITLSHDADSVTSSIQATTSLTVGDFETMKEWQG